jgi:dTDP-4-amino-4,6-dideoxygalactose transaminase
MTTNAADTLEIEGGTPTRSNPFPERSIADPAPDEQPVETLEHEFATYLGIDAANTIAVSRYEVAATLALSALAIDTSPGGEVVLPALGAERIADVLRNSGLTIVPAEVEADTANLGTRGLDKSMGDRTRLVAGAHAYGHPFTGTDIALVLEPRSLPLLEDASAAVGASYRFRPTGTLGSAAVFEFALPHLITAGADGGAMLVIADEAAATNARAQRNAAGDRIDQTAARIALAELRGAADELSARRQLAWELTFDLRARKGVSGMSHSRWVMHSYDGYVVRIRGLLWKRPLDETIAAIIAEGIPCEPAFADSLHLDPAVIAALGDDPRIQNSSYPVASRLPKEAIALPLYSAMTDTEIADIARALEKLEAASTSAGA